MKILFLVKKRLVYGTKAVCYGLVNSCQMVINTLLEHGIEAKLEQVDDGNGIDKEVYHYKPTICFLEALWATPAKIKELTKLHPKVHFIIRIHSMIPFLVSEGFSFDWLNEYTKLQNDGLKVSISCNNNKLFKDLKLIYPNVSYSPNIYNPNKTESQDVFKTDKHHTIINIGCFGALRLLKNHAQQSLWAIRLANEKNKILHFHVNVSDYETDQTSPILANLHAIFSSGKHKLIEHTWEHHHNFLKLVEQMDISMNVSYTETFNIICSDSVYMNVPVVCSEEISFVDQSFIVSPSNPEHIIDVMKFCLDRNKVNPMLRENKNLLKKSNEEAIRAWLHLLKNS